MKGMIIGAGIGGLSTAIALHRHGIDVKVYEAARNLSAIGAGILVPPNAMAILKRYKLSQPVQDNGCLLDSLEVVDTRGNTISKTPASFTKGDEAYRTVAIHRGALQQVLLAALEPGLVITSHECIGVNSSSQGAEAEFRNGSRVSARFLIGADGIHSTIRECIFPNSPLRYAGQICWRGVANIKLSAKWQTQLTEAWGNGLRFGFVQIAPEQVYWYATQRAVAGRSEHVQGDIKEHLFSLFGQFSGPVKEIIEQTNGPSIIHDDINDLSPLKSWFSNSIILIGDAAHASTPNLGQGGAQAIEDSWVLADKIATYNSIDKAFEQFQTARFAKVRKIVNVSWQIGKITNLTGSTACKIRNALFRRIPAAVSRKQACMLYDISY